MAVNAGGLFWTAPLRAGLLRRAADAAGTAVSWLATDIATRPVRIAATLFVQAVLIYAAGFSADIGVRAAVAVDAGEPVLAAVSPAGPLHRAAVDTVYTDRAGIAALRSAVTGLRAADVAHARMPSAAAFLWTGLLVSATVPQDTRFFGGAADATTNATRLAARPILQAVIPIRTADVAAAIGVWAALFLNTGPSVRTTEGAAGAVIGTTRVVNA